MLESLTLEKSTSRIIQILKPHMRVHTFKLGRGLDQDLRVNDISVSRYHAQIKFLYDRFILLDNLSKFGTLVMVKRGLEIYPGQSRSVQVGRTVINFHLSYQTPHEVKSSQILYAPKSQIERLLSVKDQSKVRDQVNQIYESLKENEMYQKRQKMIHMQLHENNFDINHIYLQRRQLNIQDEEHINYQSDEEEKKVENHKPEVNDNQADPAEDNQQLLINPPPFIAAAARVQGVQGAPAIGAGLAQPIVARPPGILQVAPAQAVPMLGAAEALPAANNNQPPAQQPPRIEEEKKGPPPALHMIRAVGPPRAPVGNPFRIERPEERKNAARGLAGIAAGPQALIAPPPK